MKAPISPPIEVANAPFTADRLRADGSRTFWAIIAAGGSHLLRRWDDIGDVWRKVDDDSARTSWLEAIAYSDVAEVRGSERTDYTALDSEAVLSRLSLVGDSEPVDGDWATTGTGHQLDLESDYAHGHIVRLATMNGAQFGFVETDGMPVAWLGGSEPIGGAVIASFHWDNGWGSGSSELKWNRAGVAVATSQTEDGLIARGFRANNDAQGLTDVRSDWEGYCSELYLPQAFEAVHDTELAEEYGIEATLEHFPLGVANGPTRGRPRV